MSSERTKRMMFDSCMGEMLRRVGVEDAAAFLERHGKEDWYRMRSWTEAEEGDFRDWMIWKLRRARWSKRDAMKETSWFLLCYGLASVPEGCMKVAPAGKG